MKILHLLPVILVSFLHPAVAFSQTEDQKILREVVSIEANLYRDPINAKFRLQELIEANHDVSDSIKSLIYLKWGTALGMTNNTDSAIWACKKAYGLASDRNIEKGSALKILAILYRLKHDFKEAEEALKESLRLNAAIWKDPMHDAITRQEYGSLCLDQYDYARAISFFLQALDTLQSSRFINTKKSMLIAKVRINLAESYMSSGNNEMAIREFELSIPVLDSLQDIEGLVRSGEKLANAYFSSGFYDRADSVLNRLYPLTEKLENEDLKTIILLAKGKMLLFQGKPDPALQYFRKSFALFNKNNSSQIIDCVNPYLEALIKTGGETEARKVLNAPLLQSILPGSLPKDLLSFRKNAIRFLWKDKTKEALHLYYQDMARLADSVNLDEKRKSALEAQAKYQFERQKETENHLLTENAFLKEKDRAKKIQLLLSVSIGLLVAFLLLLMVRRLQQRTQAQKEQIAAKEKEIRHHSERREWAEREKSFREQLIQQQKGIITKNIEDAEKLQAQLERMVHEQQESQRQEMLNQFELIKQDLSGIDLLITQFNALHPLFTQTLVRRYPKLSQADVQFCTFVRMNLTTKEISLLLHIEPRSIYVKKYRIMGKMGLGENDDFEKLLFDIG